MKKILGFGLGGFALIAFVLCLLVAGQAMAEVVAEAVAPTVTPEAQAAMVGQITVWLNEYWTIVTTVIAIASMLANATKNESDNTIVQMLNKILGILSLNFNVKQVLKE